MDCWRRLPCQNTNQKAVFNMLYYILDTNWVMPGYFSGCHVLWPPQIILLECQHAYVMSHIFKLLQKTFSYLNSTLSLIKSCIPTSTLYFQNRQKWFTKENKRSQTYSSHLQAHGFFDRIAFTMHMWKSVYMFVMPFLTNLFSLP